MLLDHQHNQLKRRVQQHIILDNKNLLVNNYRQLLVVVVYKPPNRLSLIIQGQG